jgi:hypothetical protein
VQVLPDPTFRASDLPTRDNHGTLVGTPKAPVNLRYLLSFFGSSEKAHLMLGAAELVLRERAVLDPTLIGQALSNHPHLQDSGLAQQTPPVRIVPSLVTLEELSRFWSGFLQMPYTVSTVYEAMTVILTSTGTPTATLPVASVKGRRGPAAPKRLDPLPVVQYNAHGPTFVVVSGSGLAEGELIEVAGTPTTLRHTGTGLAFELPPHTPAGAQTARLAPSGQPHTLLIRPALDAIRARGDARHTIVTVRVAPAVDPGQQTRLSLVNTDASAASSVSLSATQRTRSTDLEFRTELPPGTYLALLEVDGVSSLPVHRDGRYAGPLLEIGQ